MGKAAFNRILAAGNEQHSDIGPIIIAQSRTTISFLLLAPVLLFTRGWKGIRLPLRSVTGCALMGVLGIAASNYFYYFAIARTSVATAIIVQYTAPIWVLVYMALRGSLRPTMPRIGAVSLAFLGSAFALGVFAFLGQSPFVYAVGLKLNVAGVLAALCAAFSFSFYSIYGKMLIERHDRWQVFIHALFACSVFWMLVNPPWKIVAASYSWTQWGFLFIFSLVSMLFPFACFLAGLQHLDATEAIVTSCLEPVLAILIAAMFVHEMPTRSQIFGIALVLIGTLVVQFPIRRPPEIAHEP